jgi:hypothetical protein
MGNVPTARVGAAHLTSMTVNSDTSRHDHSTPHHRLVTRHHGNIGLAKRRTAQFARHRAHRRRSATVRDISRAVQSSPPRDDIATTISEHSLLGSELASTHATSLARYKTRRRETTSQPRFWNTNCSAQNPPPPSNLPRYPSHDTGLATER